MHRDSVKWFVLSVALFCQTVVEAGELKTADEVIAKYIEAIGGRQKLDSVKTMRITGKTMGMGGMEIPLVVESKRPNKMRTEFAFQGMTGVQAYDGKTGWSLMPFAGRTDPEKMPPDQVKFMAQQADMDGPLVDYKKKGHKVELIGKDEADGTDAYKLKVTRKDGDVEYHFIEAEYFLPIKVTGKREIQGMPIEFEIALGDYKDVDGLLIPHSVENRGLMGGSTVMFEKVEINVEIDDSRFTMPKVEKPEVKKADKETANEEKKEAKPSEKKDSDKDKEKEEEKD